MTLGFEFLRDQILELQNQSCKNLSFKNENVATRNLLLYLNDVFSRRLRRPDRGYWIPMKHFSPKYVTELVKNNTRERKMEQFRGYAWLHLLLNEGLLETVFTGIEQNLKTLQPYYYSDSVFFSSEAKQLAELASRLQTLSFSLTWNHTALYDFSLLCISRTKSVRGRQVEGSSSNRGSVVSFQFSSISRQSRQISKSFVNFLRHSLSNPSSNDAVLMQMLSHSTTNQPNQSMNQVDLIDFDTEVLSPCVNAELEVPTNPWAAEFQVSADPWDGLFVSSSPKVFSRHELEVNVEDTPIKVVRKSLKLVSTTCVNSTTSNPRMLTSETQPLELTTLNEFTKMQQPPTSLHVISDTNTSYPATTDHSVLNSIIPISVCTNTDDPPNAAIMTSSLLATVNHVISPCQSSTECIDHSLLCSYRVFVTSQSYCRPHDDVCNARTVSTPCLSCCKFESSTKTFTNVTFPTYTFPCNICIPTHEVYGYGSTPVLCVRSGSEPIDQVHSPPSHLTNELTNQVFSPSSHHTNKSTNQILSPPCHHKNEPTNQILSPSSHHTNEPTNGIHSSPIHLPNEPTNQILSAPTHHKNEPTNQVLSPPTHHTNEPTNQILSLPSHHTNEPTSQVLSPPTHHTNEPTNQIHSPPTHCTNEPTNQILSPPCHSTNKPTNRVLSLPSHHTNEPANQILPPPSDHLNKPANQILSPPSHHLNEPANQILFPPSHHTNEPANQILSPPSHHINEPVNQILSPPSHHTNKPTNQVFSLSSHHTNEPNNRVLSPPTHHTNEPTNQIHSPPTHCTNEPTNQILSPPCHSTNKPTNRVLSLPSHHTNEPANQILPPPSDHLNKPANQILSPPSHHLNEPANQILFPPSHHTNEPANQILSPPSHHINEPVNQILSPPSHHTNKPTNQVFSLSSHHTNEPNNRVLSPPTHHTNEPTNQILFPSNQIFSPPSHHTDEPTGQVLSPPSRNTNEPTNQIFSPPSHHTDEPTGQVLSPPSHNTNEPTNQIFSPPSHHTNEPADQILSPPHHYTNEPANQNLYPSIHNTNEPPSHILSPSSHHSNEPTKHILSPPPHHTNESTNQVLSPPSLHTNEPANQILSPPTNHTNEPTNRIISPPSHHTNEPTNHIFSPPTHHTNKPTNHIHSPPSNHTNEPTNQVLSPPTHRTSEPTNRIFSPPTHHTNEPTNQILSPSSHHTNEPTNQVLSPPSHPVFCELHFSEFDSIVAHREPPQLPGHVESPDLRISDNLKIWTSAREHPAVSCANSCTSTSSIPSSSTYPTTLTLPSKQDHFALQLMLDVFHSDKEEILQVIEIPFEDCTLVFTDAYLYVITMVEGRPTATDSFSSSVLRISRCHNDQMIVFSTGPTHSLTCYTADMRLSQLVITTALRFYGPCQVESISKEREICGLISEHTGVVCDVIKAMFVVKCDLQHAGRYSGTLNQLIGRVVKRWRPCYHSVEAGVLYKYARNDDVTPTSSLVLSSSCDVTKHGCDIMIVEGSNRVTNLRATNVSDADRWMEAILWNIINPRVNTFLCCSLVMALRHLMIVTSRVISVLSLDELSQVEKMSDCEICLRSSNEKAVWMLIFASRDFCDDFLSFF